jgi:hypothetical protein
MKHLPLSPRPSALRRTPRRPCACNGVRRILLSMYARRLIGLILGSALFCATGNLGSICEMYCNAAPLTSSHSEMSGHHHMHHDMANCRDCMNHGVRFSVSDSSCHHMDLAQAVEKSPYAWSASTLKWQAVGPRGVSTAQSYGRAPEGFDNPLTSPKSSSSTPLILSLRI